jgi:hypothetical protein
VGSNPLNLGLRFALELAGLAAMGYWGWTRPGGFLRFGLAAGVPLIAATLWGVFRVPNDPGKAPVPVPGVVRLALEIAFFGFATWGLFNAGAVTLAWIFGLVTLFHYLISYDRILRLVRSP